MPCRFDVEAFSSERSEFGTHMSRSTEVLASKVRSLTYPSLRPKQRAACSRRGKQGLAGN